MLRIILAVVVLFLALDYGMSGLVRSGWLHERFTRRLEAAFGRPVEVSNYSFSLLEGPRLEANYITVGEDPRFGNEYFLRADQVAVGLRWTALLRGRIVLGTLSFTNPHLNLVRLPDGEWNLESWLPRPPGDVSRAVVTSRVAVRPERIEVSGGRVDFKAGADKSPLALVNVEGSVQQAAPGSWQMDLRAQPFRATVAVQQAGELRLTGLVGGTSSRLRPAMFHLDWSDASLQDVLRLARGTDYGMRGVLAFQLAAQTEGPAWHFSSRTQLRQLHRWNLPLRADDPAANVNVDALWVPGRAQLELLQTVVETPHSSIRATGGVRWEFDPNASRLAVKDTRLELFSRGVQLGDLLTWYRAFHAGTAEQLALSGMAGVDVMIRGWPPRIEQGSIATESVTLSGASLPEGLRLGHAAVMFSPRKIEIPFVSITSGDGAEAFRLQGVLDRRTGAKSEWVIDGKSQNVHALLSSASALGYNLPQGWSIDGPTQFQLEWKGARWPAVRRTQGTISLAGVKIRAPFLNREITRVRGTVALHPRDLKIQLASADAFAANWSGSVERKNAGAWQFSLAADALDAAEMDRWLNPQRRQGLFDRVFSFLASPPQSAPVPAWLEGRGTLAVGQFTMMPFVLRQVRTNASVDGRQLELSNAQSDFYGGELRGTIHIDLASQPTYNLNAQFHSVSLSQLAARTNSFAGLFEGTASGKLQISAEGIGRDALLHSLNCRGTTQVSNAEYRGIDLAESLRKEVRQPGISAFTRASADFVCENGKMHFSRLMLATLQGTLTATGDVDSQRRIDFKLQDPSPPPGRDSAAQADDPPKMFQLTGTLKAPVLAPVLTRSVPK
ncbi:MAG TPA: AsmA family protein [Candidatus Acidoferrales bacterium]|nr:AsmA family protein [Candidatus Acidoferrales bacterium]